MKEVFTVINFNFLNALKTAYGEKIQDISNQVLQAASGNVLDDALSIDASNPKAEANRPGVAVRGTTSNTPPGGFKVAVREVYWHSENNLIVVLTGADLNNKSQQWIRSYVDGSWESAWVTVDDKVNKILQSTVYYRNRGKITSGDLDNYNQDSMAGLYYVSSKVTNTPPFDEATDAELGDEYNYMLEVMPVNNSDYVVQRATLNTGDSIITYTRTRQPYDNGYMTTNKWTDWYGPDKNIYDIEKILAQVPKLRSVYQGNIDDLHASSSTESNSCAGYYWVHTTDEGVSGTHPVGSSEESKYYLLEVIHADGYCTIQRAIVFSDCTTYTRMYTNGQWYDWHRESYKFSTGDSNGTIKVTLPDGTDQDVPVAGLGTAAYKPEKYFVTNQQQAVGVGYENCVVPFSGGDGLSIVDGVSVGQIEQVGVFGNYNAIYGSAYKGFKGSLVVGDYNTLRHPTDDGTNKKENKEISVWCFNLLGHHLTAGGTTGSNGGGGNILIIGHYNKTQVGCSGTGGISGTAFVVGNGTSQYSADALRISYGGTVEADGAYSSSGADYAEYIEWKDKNEQQEDRVGKFVTLDGKYISLANAGDFIVGVISASPSVVGNGDIAWQKKYLTDDFGRRLKEIVEPMNEDGETMTKHWVVNPDYNPELEYLPRESRPEWDAVGMLGFIRVYDDGTCEENGYCKVADGGIATKADVDDDSFLTPIFRVTQRISENIIEIFLR